MPSNTPIQRALLSVSDKTGVLEFAKKLHGRNIELLSTGGTAKLLADNDIPVTEVSDYTGFPEMMDGRVKTLHPKIHGGILARRGTDDAIMAEHDIPPIDLIIVNLYPLDSRLRNLERLSRNPVLTNMHVILEFFRSIVGIILYIASHAPICLCVK